MTEKPTKLAQVTNGDGRYGRVDAPDPKPTRLAQVNLVGGRGELVDIPLLGKAWIQLLPHRERNEVESASYLELEALKITSVGMQTRIAFDAIQAVHVLARAVRDPDDRKSPFGTLEQWQGLDEDVITAAWQVYTDTRYRLNPLDSMTLTDEETVGIRAALEKKSEHRLRAFGVAKLSLYLLTTASQPAISTTTPSSDGPSSPESSTAES